MKREDLFPSKYWKHEDLAESPFVGRIAYVEVETLKTRDGQSERKPVLHFVNCEKALVLNLTNYNTLAEILGSEDTDDWRRAEIELFAATTLFGGKSVGCIRVRTPAAPGTKQVRRSKRPAPDGGPQQTDLDEILGDDRLPY
jgi:hypothetical protein